MCTAVAMTTKHHYFGRNLDLEYHYNEEVVITPRNVPFHFRCGLEFNNHYAMIGMATVADGQALYYEATNERGLSMAGLNFPGNAVYHPAKPDKDNITPFELIPWVLCQCASIQEASKLLDRINIWNKPFSAEHPTTPLHWMISDRSGSAVVEPMEDSIKVYCNPTGVLTNNPPFPYHLDHICEYLNVTCEIPKNRFASALKMHPFSNGMGGIGLPGDLSSSSRFVRAAFVLNNSVCDNGESESVSQFFHILDSVAQQRGCARVNDAFEITYYSSCCNADKGIYYYKTYENSQITAVSLHNADLNTDTIIRFPLILDQQFKYIN